jgi:hypothetical protein
MTGRSARLAVPIGLLILAGCADPAAESSGNPVVAGDEQRYQLAATVLESPDHGPQLCYMVADSYPPQCDGPDVAGWDWQAVEHESAAGTSWGTYLLVGTWDGDRFTLAEPARRADGSSAEPADDPDTSPCPEPAGGWQPADPATATRAAMDEALARAATADDYAGAWLDQSYLDELELEPGELEGAANDPARLVLNLRFTGDLEEREQWIREVWGGALCVSQADRTQAELLDIQQRLYEELPELLSTGTSDVANAVTATVLITTPELQRQLDDRYGEGAVILHGWLQPVD